MYDPTIGRFISEDPIGFADDTNPFRYVKNSPTNFTDPSGFFKSGQHQTITQNGLANTGLSLLAINMIVTTNVNQDWNYLNGTGAFADPANHGTDDKIKETILRKDEFLAAARNATTPAEVFREFGKALHAIQDLYAHTTYAEWQDKRAKGQCVVGTVPLWNMTDKGGSPLIPRGVITGNYKYPWDDAPSPSHAELNKDEPGTPRGKIKNAAGTTYFQLSEDLATRDTTRAWNDLFKSLSPDMQKRVLDYAQPKAAEEIDPDLFRPRVGARGVY